MFSSFDKLSLRVRTGIFVAIGLIGVSLQIWQILHESRQGVQILYLIVAVGFIVMTWMLVSSLRSVYRNNAEIKRMEDQLAENKRVLKKLESI